MADVDTSDDSVQRASEGDVASTNSLGDGRPGSSNGALADLVDVVCGTGATIEQPLRTSHNIRREPTTAAKHALGRMTDIMHTTVRTHQKTWMPSAMPGAGCSLSGY